MKTLVLVSAAALATLTSVTASAGPCAGAIASSHVAELTPAWRDAVRALVQTTQEQGMPWSCVGGSVDLHETGDGATLVVVLSNGQRIERDVWAPDEVVPLGQALLAAPLPPPAPPAPPEAVSLADDDAPDRPEEAPAVAVEQGAKQPRLRAGAVVSPRYAGNISTVWAGVGVDAAIPFDAWSFGVYGRVDALSLRDSPDGDFSEIALGIEVRRAFTAGSALIEPSVRPSLAVVTREGGSGQPEETRVDGRIGAAVRLTWPLSERFRGVVLADGELSPSGLDEPHKKNSASTDGDPKPPPFPSYTLGLGLGVEVSLL